ncbi:MAG: hypothetical protein ACI9F9_000358 [Candidatus Paceibacteria bacterium]|jgi:hypothetical protein
MATTMTFRLRSPLALVGLLIPLASCTSWQRTENYGGWSLYVKSGEVVSTEAFFDAVQPAFEAVERSMGPFQRDVKVHAWNGGVDMADGTKGEISTESDGRIADIAGVGPARVRAFHARGDGGLFSLSGVFIGTADVGTAVHELVHAHLAENGVRVPLWFEEGFAMVAGDGAMYEGEWVTDGLACWPWRELRELDLDQAQVADLLEMASGSPHSVRDNVLVHFIGWAIVFDLYRELGVLDWQLLWDHYQKDNHPNGCAMARLQRTLENETVEEWLKRLKDPDPRVRLATARGTWKLHSPNVQRTLLATLREEEDSDVKASLAVNALATAGQVRVGRRQSGWMWRSVFPVLRSTTLESAEETSALRTLYRAYRYGNSRYDTQAALERLDRFWED